MTSNIFISEKVRDSFKPTYLMIKQHDVTGLQYLCKTVKKDPIKYKGSGTYWTNHIMKYGKEHVKTIWYELFTDIDELVNTALALSENFDVVNSDRWANLKPENGLDGGIDSETSKRINAKRVKDGTHHYIGPSNNLKRVLEGNHPFSGGEIQRKRVEDGTHHLLGPSNNLKRVLEGTHPFVGGAIQIKMVEDGTHIFLGGHLAKELSNRDCVKKLKLLLINNNLKYNDFNIKNGWYKKSEDWINSKINEIELFTTI